MKKVKFKYAKQLISRLNPFKQKIILMFIASVSTQACALFMPSIMADIVDVGIKQNGVTCADISGALSTAEALNVQISYILGRGSVMLLLTALMVAFSLWTSRLNSDISAGISSSLRRDMYEKVMNFSYVQLNRFSISSLITRTTNDVEHVKSTVVMLTGIITPPLMIAGGIIMAMGKSASMSPLIAIGAVAAGIAVFISFKLITPKIKIIQQLTDGFNLVVKERLTGAVISRVFGNEWLERKKFEKSNGELTQTSLFISQVNVFLTPFITVFMNGVSVAGIWIGACKISAAEMNVGDVMAFLQYSAMIIVSFLMFSIMIARIPKAWVSVERVFEVLEASNDPNLSKGTQSICGERIKNLEFKNVSFKYPGAKECVLSGINFDVHSGESVGIIGTTGSGKSTLVKLLAGFYVPQGGEILINSVNIDELKKDELTKRISYVPQSGALFSGDLLSNLKIAGGDLPIEKLTEILKVSQIYNFVERKGFDFQISEDGKNVSGGQRQRLAIARALVRGAEVYIFDDSFSKLDFKTDLKIRESLKKYLKDDICFVVSQRIGTIKNMNKILVMSDGELVAVGTHKELIKSCEVYRRIVELQLGSEAIA